MSSAGKIVVWALGTGGSVVASGGAWATIAIKNWIDMNNREDNRSWFNQPKKGNKSHYKFEINSFKEDSLWEQRYETANHYYLNLDKPYRQSDYSLEYMNKGWEIFRNFCYNALEDLKSKETNTPGFRQSSEMEEWLGKWEYWTWCINIKL